MQETITKLSTGSKAPDFSLTGIDGRTYSLDSFSAAPFLAVLFLANHCPYVGAWEDRFIAIPTEFVEAGVRFVAISSSVAANFPQDGFEEMKKRAEKKGYPFPYLHDADQSVARAFGATRTPEVFVFDRDRRLRYHGAIDSDFEEGPDVENYLRDALNQLVSELPVSLPETPPLGCPIKFR